VRHPLSNPTLLYSQQGGVFVVTDASPAHIYASHNITTSRLLHVI
jgi:hypothetical protein